MGAELGAEIVMDTLKQCGPATKACILGQCWSKTVCCVVEAPEKTVVRVNVGILFYFSHSFRIYTLYIHNFVSVCHSASGMEESVYILRLVLAL